MISDEEIEAVLIDYIERYGLTEKARALLCSGMLAGETVHSTSTMPLNVAMNPINELISDSYFYRLMAR